MPHRPTPIASSRRVLALDFIRRYRHEHGCSPSFGEIGAALNIKTQRVHGIVRALTEQGAIARQRGRRRGIELVRLLDNVSTADLEIELARRRREAAALPVLPLTEIFAPVLDEGVSKTILTALNQLDDAP